ncbi:hypothetical protein B0H99_107116 [Planomicrobium soli]|uniref:Uncharacterized protein n=1 Tax=Planomicrobium soli TaxID=1176648 RepID=A0A2P8GQS9_9BACL|nr:hypothetical protein B0H99_107116 [Planomicrobium soli]
MLFDPDESKIAVEPYANFIKTANGNKKSGIFIADEENQIVGYLEI